MRNIGVGIEIEGILNGKIHNIEVGEYHHGNSIPNLPRWKAEQDGSLRRYNDFGDWGECIEFVSPIFRTKKRFFEGLEDFKRKLSKNGEYELKEVISFNDSCGAHVHFSIKNFQFGDKVLLEVYPLIRRYFFKQLNKSKIKSKEEIKIHYGRNYSRILNEHNYKQDRQLEFNHNSEESGKGIEWRSPNMLNITTWAEFNEFWGIIWDTLEFIYIISQDYKVDIEEEDVLNGEDIEEYEENKKKGEEEEIKVKSQKNKRSFNTLRIIIKDKDKEKEENNLIENIRENWENV